MPKSTSEANAPDILRVVLAVLFIGLLITTSLWILRPFLPSLIWAAMIVIATWRFFLMVQRKLWGSRTLAVITMTGILILLLLLPLTIALSTIVSSAGDVGTALQDVAAKGLPEPPNWLESIPFVGPRLVQRWQQVAALKQEEALTKIRPYIGEVVGWTVSQIGGFGQILLHFILTVILAAVLYSKGETAARGVILFARRLADDRGERAAILAAQSIRAVASGVIITALIQAGMTALGLALVGIPYTVILASLTFLLCIVQIGAAPILIGTVIWLFYTGGGFSAWAFLAWAVLILAADNFVRPILIKRGADLPLLLIFAGVIGGLLAFGIIGIFIGPVVLAIGYTLLHSWVNSKEGAPQRA